MQLNWISGFPPCSFAKSCPTLCNSTDCSTPDLPVPHHLPEFAQVHVHWVSDAIQPSHPLLPSSPFAFSLSQHLGLFQWINFSHQVAKVFELPASALVLPVSIQGWFPLGLTDLIEVNWTSGFSPTLPFSSSFPSLSKCHIHLGSCLGT